MRRFTRLELLINTTPALIAEFPLQIDNLMSARSMARASLNLSKSVATLAFAPSMMDFLCGKAVAAPSKLLMTDSRSAK